MLQWQHGDDAAAYIRKGAEGGQAGDPGRDDGPRTQIGEEPVKGPLLGVGPGEEGQRRAFFVRSDGLHGKAHPAPHPGENGDLPLGAADPGGEDFRWRDVAPDAVQGEVEGQLSVTPVHASFQNGAVGCGGLEQR